MQEEHKFRVALGVFDDLTRLRKTLIEFQSVGLDAGRTAIVADPGALGGQLEAELPGLELAGCLGPPELLIRGAANEKAAKVVDYFSNETPYLPMEQLLDFDKWISVRLSEDLNTHLAGGACILVAPINSAQLEWRVSNSLLKHSVSSVQLHDLAIPR